MVEIRTLDLEFAGATEVIASFLAPVEGGFVLFDPGPASAVGALERQDLLPVPGLETGRNRLVMTNEARETQYTDFAELVIADGATVLEAAEQLGIAERTLYRKLRRYGLS